ncbi:MAG TPA: hypothetical protein VJC06_02760, partial [Candidatus Paceibacterota bacterium]
MTSISVLIFVVSSATLILLGINAYMMMRPKKQEPDEKYLVLHQRFDALSQIVSSQLQQNREASDKASATVSQLINEQLERS